MLPQSPPVPIAWTLRQEGPVHAFRFVWGCCAKCSTHQYFCVTIGNGGESERIQVQPMVRWKRWNLNKWTAGKHEVKQAGVRIPENQIKGRSKIGVGENTNQSQYQKFNIKERPTTNTHMGRNKTGGRSHRKKKTKRPTDYNKQKIQIQDLDNTQEHRIQNKQSV